MPFHLPSVAHLLFSSRTSWEFILNLDFEYSIITGKRKLAWATPVCPSGFTRRLSDQLRAFSFTWDVAGLPCPSWPSSSLD